MSDSVRPHRRQPTRLPRPWDSPGKNTGVGCHFLVQCMKVKSKSEVSQCPTLHDSMGCSLSGFSVHGIFQAKVLEWGAIAFSELTGRAQQSPPERKGLWLGDSTTLRTSVPGPCPSLEFPAVWANKFSFLKAVWVG